MSFSIPNHSFFQHDQFNCRSHGATSPATSRDRPAVFARPWRCSQPEARSMALKIHDMFRKNVENVVEQLWENMENHGKYPYYVMENIHIWCIICVCVNRASTDVVSKHGMLEMELEIFHHSGWSNWPIKRSTFNLRDVDMEKPCENMWKPSSLIPVLPSGFHDLKQKMSLGILKPKKL